MMKNIEIDILGSCVLRDIFEMARSIKGKYKVARFVQSNPPTTLGFDRLSDVTGKMLSLSDFDKTHNVWFRWFHLNAEEKVYDYLKENASTILITTLVECFYKYYIFTDGAKKSVISSSAAIDKNDILNKLDYPYEIYNPVESDATKLYPLIDRHCDKLKKYTFLIMLYSLITSLEIIMLRMEK